MKLKHFSVWRSDSDKSHSITVTSESFETLIDEMHQFLGTRHIVVEYLGEMFEVSELSKFKEINYG